MPKNKLIKIIKDLLKADIEMIFLHQLSEEELKTLADSIKDRMDNLKKKKANEH